MNLKGKLRRAGSLLKWLVVPGVYDDLDPNDIMVRRKRKARAIVIGVMILLVIMTVTVIIFQSSGVEAPILDDLAVALVLNVGVILLIALGLLVVRNLVKLYMERRGKVAGAKFQTKLVVSFLAMTLIPTLLLFAVASELISDTVDNWLNARIDTTLKNSLQVAESLYLESEAETKANAVYLSGLIERRRLLNPNASENLDRLLRRKIEEYSVDLIQVYSKDFELAAESTKEGTEVAFSLDDEPDILSKVAQGETVTDIQDQPEASIVVSLVPIPDGKNSNKVKGSVVVVKEISKRLIEKVHAITAAYEDYKQLTLRKEIIKASYQVTLALVALVLVFSAIWIGFYMAKGITVPLKTLSEATEAISKGDLGVKINLPARNDEVGQLVNAFNKMTSDLRSSNEQLELANRDLMESNIELHHWGQYIEAVLDNVAGGVISIDKSGAVTTINNSAARMFGLNAQEARGKNYRKLFDAALVASIRNMVREISHSKSGTVEKDIDLSLDGKRRTLKMNLSMLEDHDGQYMGTVFVFDDLTDLLAAQRAITWREMARVVAHEIKNPLTPIQLNVQRMRRKYENKAEDFPKVFDDATNTIIQEVHELKRLVENFAKAARLADGASTNTTLKNVKVLELSPEPNMLHDVIYEVLRLYKNASRGITITTDLDPAVQLVNIDAEQIRRVFINLLENAMDAISGDGSIMISTKRVPERSKVIVEVADTGHGVSIAVKESMFTPYFSTKPNGAGLGLAIINRVVEDHGGSVMVSENVPQGAVFTIELPI